MELFLAKWMVAKKAPHSLGNWDETLALALLRPGEVHGNEATKQERVRAGLDPGDLEVEVETRMPGVWGGGRECQGDGWRGRGHARGRRAKRHGTP